MLSANFEVSEELILPDCAGDAFRIAYSAGVLNREVELEYTSESLTAGVETDTAEVFEAVDVFILGVTERFAELDRT